MLCRTYFNPRSLHGERRRPLDPFAGRPLISIHAPCTGSDLPLITLYIHFAYFNPRSLHGERPAVDLSKSTISTFQSTLPARGATTTISFAWRAMLFQSTLPARGATQYYQRYLFQKLFQSTLPARGATGAGALIGMTQTFQSTLPARGATVSLQPSGKLHLFQSTLPARGATLDVPCIFAGSSYFNPRSLHGERL